MQALFAISFQFNCKPWDLGAHIGNKFPLDHRNIIGAEELPEQDSTLLNLMNEGDPGQLAEQLLSSDKVTDRANRPTRPTMPSNSWDNDNPTMRRIR